jgi:peptidyl-prolyl cis-trans isomerase D
MFETLRRMIVPIIVIVLFFFTAMIVLQWGMGFSRRQRIVEANAAGVVNGEEISWQAYNRLYNSLYKTESQNTDEELPDAKIREIHEKAWKQLLHDHLIMQQVAKHNVVATDEEVYAFLRYNPPPELQQVSYFQTDGKFDYQKYFNALADPQAASFWAQIEPFARESVLKQKLQEMIVLTAQVTEAEVKQFYLADNEKIKVGMVNVAYDRFSRPPPTSTEEELLQFYTEHKDDYPIEERAALNIALIEKKPESRDWELSYNKAMAIYDSIRAGADFGEMAQRYSDDVVSAKDSGDLGWFPAGQMVEEFDRRVFSMQEGQLAEPIRTQFGWHIIKLHGFKEEMDTPRGKTEKELMKKAHASHILIKTVPSQETLDRAYRQVEEFHAAAMKSGFLKAGEDLNMPVKRSGFFFRGRNIQYIGNSPEANRFAFEEKIDAISDLMENNSAFFVVQVAERLPAGMATFEEAKEKVKQDIVTYKVKTLCQDTANAIYAETQKGTDIKKAAEMHGEEYETPDAFARNSYVKGLRRDPTAMGAAFALTEPGQISQPIDYNQGTVIFKLIERPSLDLSAYNAQRDSLYSTILNGKRQALYSAWVDDLIAHSVIQNNTAKALEEASAF